MNRRDILKAGLAGPALIAAGAAPAAAQEAWPSRPIRLIVPFPAGGPTDIIGRKYAQRAAQELGQQIVVDNKAGASGSIGTAEAARAKPDGYTLLIGTSSTHATNPTSMAQPSYDTAKDFSYVALISIVPIILAVHPDVKAATLQDFVALLKREPGKHSYGTSGAGGITHLAGELFKAKAGNLDFLHVPYKGSNPALQDVLAGHIPCLTETFGTTIEHHRAGRLKILASFAEKRSKAAAEVPTAIEAGFPDLVAYTFNLVAAPAGTPQPIIDRLLAVTKTVMGDAAFRSSLEQLSIEPVMESSPAHTREFVAAEIAKWAPIIKANGISF